jgi:hypothetical protein
VRAGLSALRCIRRASFSRCLTCLAFSRSRFAMVVLPARAMVSSPYSYSWTLSNRQSCLVKIRTAAGLDGLHRCGHVPLSAEPAFARNEPESLLQTQSWPKP